MQETPFNENKRKKKTKDQILDLMLTYHNLHYVILLNNDVIRGHCDVIGSETLKSVITKCQPIQHTIQYLTTPLSLPVQPLWQPARQLRDLFFC